MKFYQEYQNVYNFYRKIEAQKNAACFYKSEKRPKEGEMGTFGENW